MMRPLLALLALTLLTACHHRVVPREAVWVSGIGRQVWREGSRDPLSAPTLRDLAALVGGEPGDPFLYVIAMQGWRSAGCDHRPVMSVCRYRRSP